MNNTLICPYCGHDNGDYKNHINNEFVGQESCQNCRQIFPYRKIVIRAYESWPAACLNGSLHDYNTVGFTHAVVSGTPIKLARLECSICKTDIRVRRPHIQVGDIAILNQEFGRK